MLMAPATTRIQTLYQQAGWQPPAGTRTGAPDHIGLEMLALADMLDRNNQSAAVRLYVNHLALWVPSFIFTLKRLRPHPFYQTLADLTLDLILATLPEDKVPENGDPFPELPPPPVYRGSGPDEFSPDGQSSTESSENLVPHPTGTTDETAGEEAVRLRDVVKKITAAMRNRNIFNPRRYSPNGKGSELACRYNGRPGQDAGNIIPPGR
jgi:hypothetical protein